MPKREPAGFPSSTSHSQGRRTAQASTIVLVLRNTTQYDKHLLRMFPKALHGVAPPRGFRYAMLLNRASATAEVREGASYAEEGGHLVTTLYVSLEK
jgi:hypothetical protein